MTFLWPDMLWLLAALPVLVAAYVLLLRRKKKAALRYASLAIVKEALGAGQRFRRHVPPLLFLLALATMLVAVARPAAVVRLPMQQQTIILAMDVSGSMRARDVEPNRLDAAQEAAKEFVAESRPSNRCWQPRPTRSSASPSAGCGCFAANEPARPASKRRAWNRPPCTRRQHDAHNRQRLLAGGLPAGRGGLHDARREPGTRGARPRAQQP